MFRTLMFLVLLTAFSCQKDADIRPVSTTEQSVETTQLQLVTAPPNIHSSVRNSKWWKAMNPIQQEFVGLEISHPSHPPTWSKIKECLDAAANQTKVAGASPGFPLANPAGDVVLNSQADVDAFGAQGYKEISGMLEIIDTNGVDPICDLTALKKLKSIGSSLSIIANCLTTLDGLEKLKSIGELGPFGFIGVNGDNLTDIEALSKLNTLTGSLNILSTAQLTQVTDAFSKITSIESGKTTATLTSLYVLNIDGNEALTDLSTFNGLTYLEGGLLIRGNLALTDLDDFTSLSSIGDDISIYENAALQNVDALSSITSLNDNLILALNPSLTQCCGVYPLLCSNPPACTTNGVSGSIIIFDNGAGCTEADIVANGPC